MKRLKAFLIMAALICLIGLVGCSENDDPVAGDTGSTGSTGSTGDTGDSLVRTTLSGAVEGVETVDGAWAWLGIPYAAPPVDDLRWKAPQSPDPWEGVVQADTFSGECPQYTDVGDIIGDEDCLYLNVWRPQTEETDLPVYFWIHGGGNSIGTASTPFYDGSNVSNNGNLVVVTINYRLGPMGWFTHPDLRNGTELDNSGNYGTMDMVKALSWVKDNIEAFGGDPDKVTIAGESAGGTDVFSLVMSPHAEGLFHGGIAQSGGTSSKLTAEGDAHAEEVIDRLLAIDMLAEVPGGDAEAYLRSKTAAEIIDTYEVGAGGMISSPKIFSDGTVIHADGFYGALAKGEHNQVPMIIGSNKEESKLFMILGHGEYTSDQEYQTDAETSTNSWKGRGVDDPAAALTAIEGQPDVYIYEFLYGAYRYIFDAGAGDIIPDPAGYNAWPTDIGGSNYALMMGSAHAFELPFFWNHLDWFYGAEALIFTEEKRLGQEALSDAMMDYAAEFVSTGNPGDAGGVAWPPWSNEDGEPKRILLDANDTAAIIEMSTE